MKRRTLSFVAAAALLLTLLPMAFVPAVATTAAEFTANLQKTVMLDLTNYGWYGNVEGSTPIAGENGLAFYDTDTNPRILFKNLQNKDASEATYIAVKLLKNSLPAGSVIKLRVQFVMAGADFVLANGTDLYYDNDVSLYGNSDDGLYYDNGGAELHSYTIREAEAFNRTIELTVGTADSVVLYIPTNKIVNAYTGTVASSGALSNIARLDLFFADLGNSSNQVANSKAASIKEIAMLTPAPADDPAAQPAMNAFAAGYNKTVVQDLTNFVLQHNVTAWWNGGATAPSVSGTNGVYFGDVSDTYKGYALIRFDELANRDISGATYLTATLCKQALPADSVIKIIVQFVAAQTDFVIADGTTIYYDNGAAEMQSTTISNADKWSRTIELTAGAADTITLFIPINAIRYAYGDRAATAQELAAISGIQFHFADLGNKNAALSNALAASVKEIAMYTPIPVSELPPADPPAVNAFVAGMDKAVVQDMTKLNLVNYYNCWWNPGATAPSVSATNGVCFGDVSDTYKGYALIRFDTLANSNIAGATYLSVTLSTQDLPYGSVVKLRMEVAGNVLSNYAPIYYDNGDETMHTVYVAQHNINDLYTREVALPVGRANTITLFIPTAGIDAQVSNLSSMQFHFVDLGNKDTDLSNAQAAAIKEIAAYTAAPVQAPAAVPAADGFVAGMDKTVVQNLTDYTLEHNVTAWWNPAATAPSVGGMTGVGFGDVADTYKGYAIVKFYEFANRDVSKAEYLAVTFCTQNLPFGSQIKLRLEASDNVLSSNAPVYYDNGAAFMHPAYAVQQLNTGTWEDAYSREIAMTVGAADTITLFVPMSSFAASISSLSSIQFHFEDLGNKNLELSNSQAITIKEIAAYTNKPVATVNNLGVQVRGDAVDGKMALRFVFELPCVGIGYRDPDPNCMSFRRALTADSKATVDGVLQTVTDFGAILSLDANSGLTAAEVDSNLVIKVPALNLYNVEDGKVIYTAVITNVPESYNGRTTFIYARPYVACEVNGETVYAYGDEIKRCVDSTVDYTEGSKPAQRATTINGFVRRAGKYLIDEAGAEWYVKGGGIDCGSLAGNTVPNYQFCNESLYAEHAALGCNTIRLTFNWELFVKSRNSLEFRESGFNWLAQNVEWAKKYNIRLILNMHRPPCGTNDLNVNVHQPYLFWNETYKQQWKAIWREIARRFVNEPTILAYSMWNEQRAPIVGSSQADSEKAYGDLYQECIDAIRTVDNAHMIVCEQIYDQQDEAGNLRPTSYPAFPPLKEKNLMYEYHNYYPYDFTYQNISGDGTKIAYGTTANYNAILNSHRPYANYRDTYNVPVFCGEWGAYYDAYREGNNAEQWAEDMLNVLKELEMQFTIHTPFAMYSKSIQPWHYANGTPTWGGPEYTILEDAFRAIMPTI